MVVAAVAIIIVAALILTGAGQSGPLSGRIGSTPTELTLSVTVLAVDETGYVGDRLLQFSGTLTSFDGTPVPDRTVTIMFIANPPFAVKTATTETNGAFSVTYGEYRPASYYAVFAGDDQYQTSQSSVIYS